MNVSSRPYPARTRTTVLIASMCAIALLAVMATAGPAAA